MILFFERPNPASALAVPLPGGEAIADRGLQFRRERRRPRAVGSEVEKGKNAASDLKIARKAARLLRSTRFQHDEKRVRIGVHLYPS